MAAQGPAPSIFFSSLQTIENARLILGKSNTKAELQNQVLALIGTTEALMQAYRTLEQNCESLKKGNKLINKELRKAKAANVKEMVKHLKMGVNSRGPLPFLSVDAKPNLNEGPLPSRNEAISEKKAHGAISSDESTTEEDAINEGDPVWNSGEENGNPSAEESFSSGGSRAEGEEASEGDLEPEGDELAQNLSQSLVIVDPARAPIGDSPKPAEEMEDDDDFERRNFDPLSPEKKVAGPPHYPSRASVKVKETPAPFLEKLD